MKKVMLLKIIKFVFEYLLLFHLGGCIYYYIEVIARGWSHWSMYILAGICFVFISIQGRITWWDQKLYKQVIRCGLFAAAGEFITGCMVNLWLGWNVWDYATRPWNLMGQICLPMSVFFALLCLLGIGLDRIIRYYGFNEKRG